MEANFNSRPCARGDAVATRVSTDEQLFQFPPLREGRHYHEHVRLAEELISIPAPARGAT